MCKLLTRTSSLHEILHPLQKEKEILEVKHKRNVSFLEAREIVGTYMEENSYASVAWRADTTNQNNKYRTLVEKLIQLEANNWPKFQELNFTKHQLSIKLGMRRDPMLLSKQKKHVGSTTPTQTAPKSAKSPTKVGCLLYLAIFNKIAVTYITKLSTKKH